MFIFISSYCRELIRFLSKCLPVGVKTEDLIGCSNKARSSLDSEWTIVAPMGNILQMECSFQFYFEDFNEENQKP